MTTNELIKHLESRYKEIEKACHTYIPIKIGSIAQEHFQDNFYKSGFVNNGLKPWKRSIRQSGTNAHARRGTLIGSGTANLMNGVQFKTNGNKLTVFNNVPYASTHNWGETIHPNVTPKMRRFAWAKFYEATGAPPKGISRKVAAKKPVKGRKKKLSSIYTPSNLSLNRDAILWKGLALTRKTKLTIKMPQRQFVGASKELDENISQLIETEISKIMNK